MYASFIATALIGIVAFAAATPLVPRQGYIPCETNADCTTGIASYCQTQLDGSKHCHSIGAK